MGPKSSTVINKGGLKIEGLLYTVEPALEHVEDQPTDHKNVLSQVFGDRSNDTEMHDCLPEICGLSRQVELQGFTVDILYLKKKHNTWDLINV